MDDTNSGVLMKQETKVSSWILMSWDQSATQGHHKTNKTKKREWEKKKMKEEDDEGEIRRKEKKKKARGKDSRTGKHLQNQHFWEVCASVWPQEP